MGFHNTHTNTHSDERDEWCTSHAYTTLTHKHTKRNCTVLRAHNTLTHRHRMHGVCVCARLERKGALQVFPLLSRRICHCTDSSHIQRRRQRRRFYCIGRALVCMPYAYIYVLSRMSQALRFLFKKPKSTALWNAERHQILVYFLFWIFPLCSSKQLYITKVRM